MLRDLQYSTVLIFPFVQLTNCDAVRTCRAYIRQRCARVRDVNWGAGCVELARRVSTGTGTTKLQQQSSSAPQSHLNDVIVLELLKKLDLSQRREVRPLRVLPQLHGDLLDSHDAPGRFLRLKRS